MSEGKLQLTFKGLLVASGVPMDKVDRVLKEVELHMYRNHVHTEGAHPAIVFRKDGKQVLTEVMWNGK